MKLLSHSQVNADALADFSEDIVESLDLRIFR
jgi:hypothetical protein